ncbi:hypothetical protein DFP73DRAFT_65503 [Morchella snyderi]|nr:hypothetical protein DFP73DRAFT_65503 [Morchella snyderi]
MLSSTPDHTLGLISPSLPRPHLSTFTSSNHFCRATRKKIIIFIYICAYIYQLSISTPSISPLSALFTTQFPPTRQPACLPARHPPTPPFRFPPCMAPFPVCPPHPHSMGPFNPQTRPVHPGSSVSSSSSSSSSRTFTHRLLACLHLHEHEHRRLHQTRPSSLSLPPRPPHLRAYRVHCRLLATTRPCLEAPA